MKAKDYFALYEQAEDKDSAVRDILEKFVQETDEIGKARGVRSPDSFIAVVEEQGRKWQAFAKLVGEDVKESAFTDYYYHKYRHLRKYRRGR